MDGSAPPRRNNLDTISSIENMLARIEASDLPAEIDPSFDLAPKLLEKLKMFEDLAAQGDLTFEDLPDVLRHIEVIVQRMEQLQETEETREPPNAVLKPPQPYRMKDRVVTNIEAASAMYWMTFALGKFATNGAAALCVHYGRPDLAPWMALINSIGVPILQVGLAEPMAGAIRSGGPTHPSPDAKAYTNYNTAFACWVGACIEGDKQAASRYSKIMGEIVDGLIEREGQGHIPQAFTSGVTSVPVRRANDGSVVKAIQVDGQKKSVKDPALPVMWSARGRVLVTDELGVQTFSVGNFFSSLIATLVYNKQLGNVAGKGADFLTHTAFGTASMIGSYAIADVLRPLIQGTVIRNPADKDNLELAIAAAKNKVAFHEYFVVELGGLRDQLKRYEKQLKQLSLECPEEQYKEVEGLRIQVYAALEIVAPIVRSAKRMEAKAKIAAELQGTSGGRDRAAADKALAASRGELGQQADPWLDGRPIVIRNISKKLGYMTSLAPSVVQAVTLGLYLYNKKVASDAGAANPNNGTFADVNGTFTNFHGTITDVNGTIPNINGTTTSEATPLEELVWATTIPLTALTGWMFKNLIFSPIWETGLHIAVSGSIAVANTVKHFLRTEDASAQSSDDEYEDDPDMVSDSRRVEKRDTSPTLVDAEDNDIDNQVGRPYAAQAESDSDYESADEEFEHAPASATVARSAEGITVNAKPRTLNESSSASDNGPDSHASRSLDAPSWTNGIPVESQPVPIDEDEPYMTPRDSPRESNS